MSSIDLSVFGLHLWESPSVSIEPAVEKALSLNYLDNAVKFTPTGRQIGLKLADSLSH
jgi:hypothetical protein